MMGLEIYNSKGIKTFGGDSSVLYYAGTNTVRMASMNNTQISNYFKVPPPYAISILNDGGTSIPDTSNGTTFYQDKFLPLRQTPLNVYPMESFGLQSWDENGVLELDPRRRPLVVEEIKYVEGELSSGINSIDQQIYDLWDADGYGVLFLDFMPRLTYMEMVNGYAAEALVPTVERVNGRYRLRVFLEFYATGTGGYLNRVTSAYRGAFGKVKTFR